MNFVYLFFLLFSVFSLALAIFLFFRKNKNLLTIIDLLNLEYGINPYLSKVKTISTILKF